MTPRSLRHRAGTTAATLALVAVSFGLAIGAVELLLRANVIPNEYYVRNEILGKGDRDGFRLLILGDSFMAPQPGGDIVDDLYQALGARGVRIRNTAMAGTGPVQYLQNLRREGSRHRPDVVVLSYYVGNDLLDVGCGGNLEARLTPPPPDPAWKRSYTAQYVRERLRARFPGRIIFQSAGAASLRWLSAIGAMATRGSTQEVDYAAMKKAGIPEEYITSARAGLVNPWIMSLGARRPDYYRDELYMESDCAREAWEDTREVLGLIVDEAARLQARVLPVIHPHTFQVSRAHYDLYRAWKIEVEDRMLETRRPQELLGAFFRSRGIEPLDLLDRFREHPAPLYWEKDEHLNMEGQALAARLMADAISALRSAAPR